MILIKNYPKNKNFFIRLKNFGKDIIRICKINKVNPILSGSLAYFIYTNDKNIKVNDLDFYIPEDSFQKIIKILKKKRIKYHYDIKWRTIQIFKNHLKIELDSMNKAINGGYLPRNYKKRSLIFNFDGFRIKLLGLKDLKGIYKRASEFSDKPKQNLKKFRSLDS